MIIEKDTFGRDGRFAHQGRAQLQASLANRHALPGDFTRIIQLVEGGRTDTTPWITHRAACDDAVAEFPAWTRPETGVSKARLDLSPPRAVRSSCPSGIPPPTSP